MNQPTNQLKAYLTEIQNQIITIATQKGMNVTGQTLNSLEVVETLAGYDLLASPNIWFMEHGRGPTHPGAPTGNPTLKEVITDWIAAKGLDLNPWAVTRAIHQNGTKLYRSGNGTGILSVPLNLDRLHEVFSSISAQYLQNTTDMLFDELRR